MFSSVLAVFDSSDASRAAVRRAQLVAAQHHARLTLLHVVRPSTPKPLLRLFDAAGAIDTRVAQARAMLGALAERITRAHDIHVTTVVEVGDAFEHLHALADGIDLLVLGVRRGNPLRERIFGAPTERLLRTCARPVLLVKVDGAAAYREVLVPVDFTDYSEVSLRTALRLAPAASVEVFHALSDRREARMRVADVPPQVIREHRDSARGRALVRLCSIAAAVAAGEGVRVCVAHGDPAEQCLKRQKLVAADLLVIGKDGQSVMGDYLLGSVAQRLLAQAPCDMLVIPKAALSSWNRGYNWLQGAADRCVPRPGPIGKTA